MEINNHIIIFFKYFFMKGFITLICHLSPFTEYPWILDFGVKILSWALGGFDGHFFNTCF